MVVERQTNMTEYAVEWAIRGTTKIPAPSSEEAEKRAHHMSYQELAFVGNTGVPTVTSFEVQVQGADAPKTITVTKLHGNEWSAQAGPLAKHGGNPWAAVINLVEDLPVSVLEEMQRGRC